MTATAWKEHLFFVFVCFLPLLSCHLFSMKFFRQLIPSNRTSNITVAKTTAGSILSCNLKCINNKPCISTLFFKGQKKCILLKSFFNGMKENPETPKNDNSTKVVESRSRVSLFLSKYDTTLLNTSCVEGYLLHGPSNTGLLMKMPAILFLNGYQILALIAKFWVLLACSHCSASYTYFYWTG